MNKIFLWFKRIFSSNVIIAILTVISVLLAAFSAWITYKLFSLDHGGEIAPVLYSCEIEGNNRSVIVYRTQDSVLMMNPQLVQKFKNTSNKTIHDFKILYTLVLPGGRLQKAPCKLTPGDGFTFVKQEYDYRNNTDRFTYEYKTPVFFPQDVSPDFIKYWLLLPAENDDTLYHHFSIESTVLWNGEDPHIFSSKINFVSCNDTISTDTVSFEKISDPYNSFANWFRGLLSGVMTRHPEQCEVMVAWHLKNDSTKFEGTFFHFKPISCEVLDSLLSNQSPNVFLERYTYTSFNPPPQKHNPIKGWDFWLEIILFLILLSGGITGLTLYVMIQKEHDTSPAVVKWSLFLFGILCIVLSYNSLISILYYYNITAPSLLTIIFTSIQLLILIWFAIILIYLFTRVRSQVNRKDRWKAYILLLSLLIIVFMAIFYSFTSIRTLYHGVLSFFP